MDRLIIVGGGLAGCEAAYQAAIRGIDVDLYEMRPEKLTPAHTSGQLAELVCSNSLGSLLPDRASGLLADELSKLGSILLKVARLSAVPSGGALSVDREQFSRTVEQILLNHPRISIIRKEMPLIPDQPAIIASGPLTSDSLAKSIQNFSGHKNLFFFDAISPIVHRDSIDFSIAFHASRFAQEKGQTADYINCPFSKDEFETFVKELTSAERIPLKSFEGEIEEGVRSGPGKFFEACLPVEVIASRGTKSLTFGPMRPIGLIDPRSDQRPYAVLQLREDNIPASLYNMVGFQTNLTFSEQKRVFRMIPGLRNSEFARYGQMHRNTFIYSPDVLRPSLQSIKRHDLFFAGQIAGVEGYLGNIGTGLLAGINAANYLKGKEILVFPSSTMLGAICRYINQPSRSFQPMKANFGLLPELEDCYVPRPQRAARYVSSAVKSMDDFLGTNQDLLGLQ